MVARKMCLFRKGQKQRLKSIWIETLRHSYQNTSLLLCPVTHWSKDLIAFTCLTSDSLPVSASTLFNYHCVVIQDLNFHHETPDTDLAWAVPLRQSHTFSHYAIQRMETIPPLQFAAQSQTSAQSRFACSPYWAHGNPHSHTHGVWRHPKGKAFGCPQSLPVGPGPPRLCRSPMSERRWGTGSTSPVTHFLVTSPADPAVLILCLFCRWWANPFSRRVKEWHQELG